MEEVENFLEFCALDEEKPATAEETKKSEKKRESNLGKVKRDIEEKELKKNINREKRKIRQANRHQERVAFLSKMTLEERKEYIHKERAAEKESCVSI